MKICDRCHASKNVKGPYETGVRLQNEEMVRAPAVVVMNIDFCDRCVGELREVIREFLVPIAYIEVKPNVKNSIREASPEGSSRDNFTEAFDAIPSDLV